MKKIIFVADAFSSDYPFGGAELTTEAILKKCKLPVKRIKSSELTLETINNNKDSYWIFGNFFNIKEELILEISQTLEYSIIEYDYKYCVIRSSEVHEIYTKNKCNCHNERRGKIVSIFFGKARNLFWMSEAQRDFYFNLFPFLSKKNNIVLSSIFDDEDLDLIKKLDCKNKNNSWIILGSSSLIKGVEETIKYAKDNGLEYEIIKNLSRQDLLKKLSESKGLLFQPLGKDTCPRLVIEAKLLNCELIINNNVQHGKESWFNQATEEIFNYLKNRANVFWKQIYSDIKFTSTKNNKFLIVVPCYNVENWIEKNFLSIKNQKYSNFECIYIDDISTDSTAAKIKSLIKNDQRFKLIENKEKKYSLRNIYEGIQAISSSDEDVVITVDGDDWLYNDFVLNEVNNYYQSDDVLLTYGKHTTFPANEKSEWIKPYPQHVIENNLYRQYSWFASHLRTFKYKLWKNIEISDLMDEDGFYKVTWDMAMMFPMLEMANGKFAMIDKVLYVYNRETPLNDDKVNREQQLKKEVEIRNKKRYINVKY
jgi:hypothetical protein